MRCSVLDLGSNSSYVLVADLDGCPLLPLERTHALPRRSVATVATRPA